VRSLSSPSTPLLRWRTPSSTLETCSPSPTQNILLSSVPDAIKFTGPRLILQGRRPAGSGSRTCLRYSAVRGEPPFDRSPRPYNRRTDPSASLHFMTVTHRQIFVRSLSLPPRWIMSQAVLSMRFVALFPIRDVIIE
jgi:hypothetical protein